MDLSDCSRLLYHWAISPTQGSHVFRSVHYNHDRAPWWSIWQFCKYPSNFSYTGIEKRRWYNGQHSCLPSSWSGFDSRPRHNFLSFDSVLTFKICILQTNEDGIHQKGHWGHCDTWSGNCLKTRPESQIIQNILTKVGMWIHFWLHN